MSPFPAFPLIIFLVPLLLLHPFTAATPSSSDHRPSYASTTAQEGVGINVHLTLAPPLLSLVTAANSKFVNQTIRFPQPHTPHVTLYMSTFPESSLPHLLDAIRHASNAAVFTQPCSSHASSAVAAGSYSMLPVTTGSCLQNMSDVIVARTHHLALPNQTAPAWLLLLPEPQRSRKMDMLNRFGSPNVFGEYDAHITLACSENATDLAISTRALDGISSPFVPLQLRVSRSGACGTALSQQTLLSINLSPVANSSDSMSSSKFGLRQLLNSLASALFAGCIAALATFAVERLGGVKGGILAATPSTILPALIGIKSNSASHADFAASVWLLPVGALCNSIFLATWRYGPPRLPLHWSLRRKCVKSFIAHVYYFTLTPFFRPHNQTLFDHRYQFILVVRRRSFSERSDAIIHL